VHDRQIAFVTKCVRSTVHNRQNAFVTKCVMSTVHNRQDVFVTKCVIGLLCTTRRDGFVTKCALSQVKSVHKLCSWSDADTIIRDTHNFWRIVGWGCIGMLGCHGLCQVGNYRRFEVTCCLRVWGRTTNSTGQKSDVRDIYGNDSGLKVTNDNGQ
jgi:hypothetical protein